ncbi:exodeoxyribonuclease V subunit gamma [Enterovibrio norvegicus FF-454]|uniref:RecBCD enzyme subunit RecC n=1 Tax=Enterovibrio norvegicus FF-454 TaxID=1185651 RepID=A0A1E5CAE8_9GAMM|nr:exodeoxyribonuclease V subunit gamma [Enterovibrio norvegicus]OEE62397.1 exodeoxyribonuclease V subunit gamma [Enterovibrio norvegicus FF-454]
MFTVYHSNQLDLLKSLLVAIVQQKPLDNPFQKEIILVQSPGMAQWLKLEMAKEQGIVANVEFPLPATFIWQMFTHILDGVPQRSFFNKEAMTWKLMKVLPAMLDEPDFAELKRYLEDDIDQQKLYQLAGKIADIYDQYLVYRPEWIKAWENEKPVPELEEEKNWQPLLWQALYDYTLQQGQSPFHRANLYEEFIDTLSSHSSKPEGLAGIERVFVFGISALPPRYLDALKALGQHVDVHYMFTNPCRYFWGDIRDKRYLAKRAAAMDSRISRTNGDDEPAQFSLPLGGEDDAAEIGNSLLASMGKLGRDNLLLISELQCHEVDQGFVDIPRHSLLQQIQADILDLIEPGNVLETLTSQSKQEISPDDRSVTIEVCHSPMREVEVLHDRLLDMLESDPSLTPRDIVVMVADINAYSPAIQSVFGNAPGERYIPFSISDRSADQESPILTTFLRLLGLPDSRCSAAELLEILEVPSVLRRFGFDHRQFEKVKFWVEEAGIRWGLDDQTATHFSLPDQHQNTWQFGLNRMLLGYAMPSEKGLYNDVLAYDEVQGLEADVAGKLGEFFRVLNAAQTALTQTKIGEDWVQTLTALFDDMFALDTDEELAGRLIRDQLDNWLTQLDDAGFSQTLSLAIVRDYLKEKLGGERVSQRFLAGQVNFCTLMPMRSIPFNVVCLLGMNDGDYPRTIAPVGFDLMAGRTRAGDRSRRDDDRYLFLEALQSAQQRLYISYVGRSVQDNSEKVPSVLISELLDYCRQGYCLQGDTALPEFESGEKLLSCLVHNNPLVPFSRVAFSSERQSYAAEWLPAAKGEGKLAASFLGEQALTAESEADFGIVELAELQRFWRLPVQYFFNRRLKVFFEAPSGAMEDVEPFALDNLQRYQLRDALLSHVIEHDDSEESLNRFFQLQKASGALPLSHFGELTLESEQAGILAMYERLKPYFSERRQPLEINLSIPTSRGTVLLQGWLDERYRVGRVLFRSGKVRARDRLAAWIDHLCQCAAGDMTETRFIGVDEEVILTPIPAADAVAYLTFYLEQYDEGTERPMAYLPNTALAGLLACIDKKGNWSDDDVVRDKAKIKMRAAFDGGYITTGEGENAYVRRVWPQASDQLLDDVLAWGENVLLPALNAEKKED